MKRIGAYYRLVYHYVWSTKNRLALITPTVEERLFPYISYKCGQLGYQLHAVNGTTDHVHVLVSLTPTILVADVAKNLKGASSHYINNESGLGDVLYWQDGYGVVTIREVEIPAIVKYIHDQKVHHQDGRISDFLEQMHP
ncbi:MAG: IS200/IS605 family transposase [Anaerolineales bacterium]|nr:IS200/IS605 family transposase [Anaerolineales bacterium]